MVSDLFHHLDAASICRSSNSGELRRRRLLLMSSLQASFEKAYQAAVTLDLAAMERVTLEQRELAGRLAEDIQLQRELMILVVASQPSRVLGRSFPTPWLDSEDELCRSQLGVLQAARVHAALIGRMQKKSRMLANALAGPSTTYGPPA
jgi:hypothetical protein